MAAGAPSGAGDDQGANPGGTWGSCRERGAEMGLQTESAPGIGLSLVERAVDVPPNIFAIVMATGIVSLAVDGAGMRLLALMLLALNVCAYVILWILLGLRVARNREGVAADLGNPARAPGFFTIVAGTGVLGSQVVVLAGQMAVGQVMWFATLGLWLVLTYVMLPGLMGRVEKPPLERALHGAWLLAVVGTQSVCVLGCRVAGSFGEDGREPVFFVGLLFWLEGVMVYVWLITLIFYRCAFLPLAAADLTPPYWISMGAMAISTMAGVSLVRAAGASPLIEELLPFVKGVTLLCWAVATWWIPLLVALGVWRHVGCGVPLRYDHGYWSVVFPLGMYTVCTQGLVSALGLPLLAVIPGLFVWIALGAWCVVFAGLCKHLARGG